MTIVTQDATVSMGTATGVPWKFAPVSTRSSSGMKIGLSAQPLSSISTCERAHASASRSAPITWGVERIE